MRTHFATNAPVAVPFSRIRKKPVRRIDIGTNDTVGPNPDRFRCRIDGPRGAIDPGPNDDHISGRQGYRRGGRTHDHMIAGFQMLLHPDLDWRRRQDLRIGPKVPCPEVIHPTGEGDHRALTDFKYAVTACIQAEGSVVGHIKVLCAWCDGRHQRQGCDQGHRHGCRERALNESGAFERIDEDIVYLRATFQAHRVAHDAARGIFHDDILPDGDLLIPSQEWPGTGDIRSDIATDDGAALPDPNPLFPQDHKILSPPGWRGEDRAGTRG